MFVVETSVTINVKVKVGGHAEDKRQDTN